MNREDIVLKNVRVHNLKGINLRLRPNQLIAFTGVSGSGKSSLAFDTIYVEGQRRYAVSLSSYFRKHLGDLPKPLADSIEGVSPSIAIEQKTVGNNPRSTVGTVTGIYDFLRVLFANVATARCPVSLRPLSMQSLTQILDEITSLPEGSPILILANVASGKKGQLQSELQDLLKKGFSKIRLDGEIIDVFSFPPLDKSATHDLDLVIDRLDVCKENRERIASSVQLALKEGNGLFSVLLPNTHEEKFFSLNGYSAHTNSSYPPLEPHDFSFNHPRGMCPDCQGLGFAQEFDLSKILDEEKSVSEDCCKIAGAFNTIRYANIYRHLAHKYKTDLQTPWKLLPKAFKTAFLSGCKQTLKVPFSHPNKATTIEHIRWEGVLKEAKDRYLAAKSERYKEKFQEYFHQASCSTCQGSKLKPYPSQAILGGLTITQITNLPIKKAVEFFQNLPLAKKEAEIGGELVKEIIERLSFLNRVGLDYLCLDRTAPTLSGGEGQRVRLASQIGSGLVGSTYILDEPSIGLHPTDNDRLLGALMQLRDKGNTVIVVEHDEETIFQSDYVVDVGPLAGNQGGKLVAQGTVDEIMQEPDSLTGLYLAKKLRLPESKRRPIDPTKQLRLSKVSHHNLKEISVSIPLGVFIAVTGVSGSGKSSLIIDVLYPAIANRLQGSELKVGQHESIAGLEHIDKVIPIDQSPIGRTPRSNPATYVKVFDEIRDLFSQLPESKAKGFEVGRFSFNVVEGSCPACSGMGMLKVDMDFLEDEWVPCHTCAGKQFDESTLSVHFKGKNIYDVLQMTVAEAALFFQDQPRIYKKLDLLMRVGLDYIRLGQPSPTLSGGEAERIKLAKELSRPSTGKTLYILDEPTTGLHFHDIKNLLQVLHALVDKGNTILVIEHNMDCIKNADWIIDLGPGSGEQGGKVIAEGSIETIIQKKTPTGLALQKTFTPLKPAPKNDLAHTAQHLTVRGAWQNNLKGVDAAIPLGAITICTGPSGSGKSSFAFETVYAEGQRRYTDTMSHYTRQFIKQMPKPKVDFIDGLSAAIALEQSSHAGSSRSTVGTITEIYDYLRLLFCHMGIPYCPETGEQIQQIDKDYILDKLLALEPHTKCVVLSPPNFHRNESFTSWQARMLKQGFARIRLNGEYYGLEDQEIPFDPKKQNALFLVVDRIVLRPDARNRILEALEQSLKHCEDTILIATPEKDLRFHLAFTAPGSGLSYPPISPHTFSFNTEHGMCQDCLGIGSQYGADALLLQDLLLLQPAQLLSLLCKDQLTSVAIEDFLSFLRQSGIPLHLRIGHLDPHHRDFLLKGDPTPHTSTSKTTWKGFLPVLAQYAKSSHGNIRSTLSLILQEHTCPFCEGSRLNPLARNVRIQGISIADFCNQTVEENRLFLKTLTIDDRKIHLLEEPLYQMQKRLELLEEIGLGYLSLARSAPTLSGGEMQRIRLSKQLGSGLSGCLYVLDEPTIGLHPHDNDLLNKALLKLKSLGNTLVLVEHDPQTLAIADHILDFGPEAGEYGGHITASGSLQQIVDNPASLTGLFLSGKLRIPIPQSRRTPKSTIEISQASLHNIKNLNISIPTGVLCCFTGVSGSGKSTLVMNILKPAIEDILAETKNPAIQIHGAEIFDKLIVLDQIPAGSSGRADVSTYTDLANHLRVFYASLPDAKLRWLTPSSFSYNHPDGMCRSCNGLGKHTISLQFLPPVEVECDCCKGLRLNQESLSISFLGKSLGEVLKMSAADVGELFLEHPKICKICDTLIDVGLDYVSIGQDLGSLSGGESQRLRLCCELLKTSKGHTLYIFDEPSIGLHSCDIAKLVPIFQKLVDKGNTLILIEHHLDLICQADYVIDMGPSAGKEGGTIVAMGTPEELASSPVSKTAPFIREHLSFVRKSRA